MAQTQAYQDVQPEALEIESGNLGADYAEDRSVSALAERRRQALANTDLSSDQNPLLSIIGAFETDPEYDALMEDVYEYRRQLDARENQKVD